MLIAHPIVAVEPLVPPHRQFSLEEANRALGYLGRVVGDLVAAHREVVRVRDLIEGAGGEWLDALEADYLRLVGKVRECLHELEVVGVEVCDFEKGTLMFPARPEMGVACLAWTLGMPAVV